jgi:hypothetical protein
MLRIAAAAGRYDSGYAEEGVNFFIGDIDKSPIPDL